MKKLCFALILGMLLFGCQSTPEEAPPQESPPPQAQQDASFGAAAPPSATDATANYNRGNELFGRHAFDQAINEYTEALKKDPKMAEAHIARGNAYSGKLELEAAQKDYDAGAQINADYDHYARGYSMYVSRNYKSAIDEFSQAIAQKSNLLAAYNDRGLAYANTGNVDQAIADYDEALKINNNSALTYNNRGNAYLAKGDYEKAAQDYSRASELYPALTFSHSGRGRANYRSKSYDDAIADYTKAIAITPEDSALYSLRRDAYEAKGEKALAEADKVMAEKLRK